MTIRYQLALSLVTTLVLCTPQYWAEAQSARVVCIASNGDLTVRTKQCQGSEKQATMSNLQQVGAKGATGPAGKNGVLNRRIELISDTQLLPIKSQSHVFAFCNDDEVVLSGGCGCFDGFCNSLVSASGPMPVDSTEPGRSGWRCTINPSVDPDLGNYKAYAICAEAN